MTKYKALSVLSVLMFSGLADGVRFNKISGSREINDKVERVNRAGAYRPKVQYICDLDECVTGACSLLYNRGGMQSVYADSIKKAQIDSIKSILSAKREEMFAKEMGDDIIAAQLESIKEKLLDDMGEINPELYSMIYSCATAHTYQVFMDDSWLDFINHVYNLEDNSITYVSNMHPDFVKWRAALFAKLGVKSCIQTDAQGNRVFKDTSISGLAGRIGNARYNIYHLNNNDKDSTYTCLADEKDLKDSNFIIIDDKLRKISQMHNSLVNMHNRTSAGSVTESEADSVSYYKKIIGDSDVSTYMLNLQYAGKLDFKTILDRFEREGLPLDVSKDKPVSYSMEGDQRIVSGFSHYDMRVANVLKNVKDNDNFLDMYQELNAVEKEELRQINMDFWSDITTKAVRKILNDPDTPRSNTTVNQNVQNNVQNITVNQFVLDPETTKAFLTAALTNPALLAAREGGTPPQILPFFPGGTPPKPESVDSPESLTGNPLSANPVSAPLPVPMQPQQPIVRKTVSVNPVSPDVSSSDEGDSDKRDLPIGSSVAVRPSLEGSDSDTSMNHPMPVQTISPDSDAGVSPPNDPATNPEPVPVIEG